MNTIQKTQGVNGGGACIGQTRIAVWMLEAARREGFSDEDILVMYPQLTASDLSCCWKYINTHKGEIEQEVQENDMLKTSSA
ncbi:DUF433 domain-containing protein [bacterium]|nr:MAG: DUF433 domain-containing protein [bacterium]